MSARRHLLIAILLICLIASCASPPPATPAAPSILSSATSAIPSILPNELVKAEGQVTVKRRQATGFVPAGVGTQVEPGDLLRVEEGGAAIFCGNEAEWDSGPRPLTAGESHGVPCLAGRSPRTAFDQTRLRGQTNARVDDIPYVLSPRTGFVRSDRPMLRWHTLTNTDAYTITLVGDDRRERPPVRAGGGELAYPDAWPALMGGGASYRLVVQAGERSSEEEVSGKDKFWGFSLLEPANATQLQNQEAKLRARPFNEDALTLLLAELYLNDAYKLRSEATGLLSEAVVEDLASAQVLLGEVYLEMGLVDEAQAAFDKALALAQKSGLPEFEAGAEFGLGTVSCLRWDRGQAEAHWQTAKDQYAKLGLVERAQKTATVLGTIEAECIRPTPTSQR